VLIPEDDVDASGLEGSLIDFYCDWADVHGW
jgi:hypothetical protein